MKARENTISKITAMIRSLRNKCALSQQRWWRRDMAYSTSRAASTLLVVLAYASCVFIFGQVCKGAIVKIDYSVVINEANSIPDSGDANDATVVQFVDGPSNIPNSSVLTDGGFIGGMVSVLGSSQLTMTGGRIDSITSVLDEAVLTIVDGSIECRAAHCGSIDIAGMIRVADAGTLNLYGGSFELGSESPKIYLQDNGVINIFGSNFDVSGELPTATTFPSVVRIQGLYPNGSSFDISVVRDGSSSQVLLHAIPEPESDVLAILALICTGLRPNFRTRGV